MEREGRAYSLCHGPGFSITSLEQGNGYEAHQQLTDR